ncbi:MAG TPA: hypothetical protein VF588_09565 [Pyrinomonadaceae bacterium]|jgi:hypothetical protein
MSSTNPGDGPNKDPSGRPIGVGEDRQGGEGEGKPGGGKGKGGGQGKGSGREGDATSKTTSKGINPVQHSE